MARLRDIPVVVRRIGFWTFLKRVYDEMNDDGLFVWAAALAYSWLFAIFPFFVFLLSLLPYLPPDTRSQVVDTIEQKIHEYLPEEAAKAIWLNVSGTLSDVVNRPQGGLLTFGAMLTLWVASGGMAMTMSAMDRCYEIKDDPWIWQQRPKAMLLTIITAALVVAVLGLLPIGTAILNWLGTVRLDLRPLVDISRWLVAGALGLPVLFLLYRLRRRLRSLPLVCIGGLSVLGLVVAMLVLPLESLARQHIFQSHGIPQPLLWVLNISRWALAIILLLIVVALVYYFGPRIRQHFRVLSPGGVLCVLLWLSMGTLFKVYVNAFGSGSYNQTYGTLAGAAILLLLFYLASLVLMIGAEINAEIDYEVLGVVRGQRDLRHPREKEEGAGGP